MRILRQPLFQSQRRGFDLTLLLQKLRMAANGDLTNLRQVPKLCVDLPVIASQCERANRQLGAIGHVQVPAECTQKLRVERELFECGQTELHLLLDGVRTGNACSARGSSRSINLTAAF